MNNIFANITKYYKNVEENKKIENDFEKSFTLKCRQEESEKILKKYPNRVPIICQRISTKVPKLDKKKYLCPLDLTIGNFMYVIRKKMELKPENGIYLFVNDTLIPCTRLISYVYEMHKADDGFLYIFYDNESTFG